MDILTNNEIPRAGWNDFLESNPFASPFQTPEFYDLFNSTKGLLAEALALTEDKQILALAVITIQKEEGLKSYFSRRGIIYGGPLFETKHPEALSVLLKQIAKAYKNDVIYIETRNFFDYTGYKNEFVENCYEYVPYLNFQLATEDLASLSKSMSSSRMRQIRKAQKNSVTWMEAQNIEEVKSFYCILLNLYKNKIGKPIFPFDFFRNFYESDLGKYFIVWFNNEIIGGIMCPIFKGKAIYEFYVCGLDEKYKEQYPSVMATWAAIQYANQNNIPVFDFMGAGKPEEHYGVREFKARFGGELVEYGRFIKIHNHFLYKVGKLGMKFKKNFTG